VRERSVTHNPRANDRNRGPKEALTSIILSKFSLETAQVAFLAKYQRYGFKDKRAVVRFALQALEQNLAQKHLQESAELYAQLYGKDPTIKDLAEATLAEWPE
jgi:hypothetical protein